MSCHATSASVCAGLLAVSEQRRQRAVLAGLSLGILTCFGGLLLCPHRAECFGALTQLDARVAAGIGIGLPLAIASVFAWMGRIVWVLTRASVRTRALPISGHMPDALRVAMRQIRLPPFAPGRFVRAYLLVMVSSDVWVRTNSMSCSSMSANMHVVTSH